MSYVLNMVYTDIVNSWHVEFWKENKDPKF